MISIIICSRNPSISDDLQNNIYETIGCDFELIIIDNSENKYSIFEAYNLGIERSNGAYLCFIHDDVLFHTQGWGEVVDRIFVQDKKIGLIGIAGSKSKTKMPSAWWDCNSGENYTHIIQHFNNKESEKWSFGFDKKSIEEVVVIDGVFMVLKKDDKIIFDKIMIGYHNYDLNISFECKKQGYKIVVTNQILIEHFSIGIINKDWIKSTSKIHNLYKNILPLNIKESIKSEKLEISNAKKFANQCVDFYQYKLAFLLCFQLFWFTPFSKFHFRFWFDLSKKIFKQLSFVKVQKFDKV